MAFAGVGICTWVLNWVCWKKQYCCFRVYHNPTIQRIFWWISFLFLCAIVSCCISGIIIVIRFGKFVKLSQCAYERIYYDSEFGQLKDSQPKWIGLENNSQKLNKSLNLINNLKDYKTNDQSEIYLDENWKNIQNLTENQYNKNIKLLDGVYHVDFLNELNSLFNNLDFYADNKKLYLASSGVESLLYDPNYVKNTASIVGRFIIDAEKQMEDIMDNYNELQKLIKNIQNIGNHYNILINQTIYDFNEISKDLKNYKSGYLDSVEYYIKLAKGFGYILVLIYFCVLCCIAILGCVLLMAYSYLKSQNNLDTLMHIIWNCLRFFVFSFFMFGAAFGMLYHGLRDLIAYNMYLFGENLYTNTTTLLLPSNKSKSFLCDCLTKENTEFKSNLKDYIFDDINSFSQNLCEGNNKLYNYKLSIEFPETFEIETKDSLRNLEKKNLEDAGNDYSDSNDVDSYDSSDSINIVPTIIVNTTQLIEIINNITIQFEQMMENLKEVFENLISLFQIERSKRSLTYISCSESANFALDTFDCGFLKNDLNILHNALYDASIECRMLCAVSCCIGFFGEILAYFYLLSMYHYNNKEFKEGDLNMNNLTRNRSRHGRAIDESSKSEFMDKSKPADMKRYNQKLDLDFS